MICHHIQGSIQIADLTEDAGRKGTALKDPVLHHPKKTVGLIQDKYNFPKNENFIAKRKGIVHMEDLSMEEKNEMIKKNPQYGNIVCRCEMVTEGEIVDAINRPIGARSLDGVKRRTRQGMGRCQAGFCTPRTMEILSRELGIPMTEITKKGEGSNMLVGKIKED